MLFANNPLYLGIFADAALNPPEALSAEIAKCRKKFDELNISVLTGLLNSKPLREGLAVEAIVEDFRIYMDFFNLRFKTSFDGKSTLETALHEHEKRCHRQLGMLLYGVFDDKNVKG